MDVYNSVTFSMYCNELTKQKDNLFLNCETHSRETIRNKSKDEPLNVKKNSETSCSHRIKVYFQQPVLRKISSDGANFLPE